jgi:beta-N-acetylhexosaminidase
MKTEQTGREKRRQRRIKNQILAYFTLAILLIVVVIAGVYGVKAITHSVSDYNEKVTQVLEEAESNASSAEENLQQN